MREEEKKREREKKKRKFGEARRFATPRNHRIDSLISDNGDTHGEERRRERSARGSTRTVRGNCRHCDACRGVFYPLVPPPEAAGGPWGRGWLCWWPRYTRRRHAHARKGACQEPFTVSMAIGARVLLVRAPVHARTLQRAVATGFGPRQPRNDREQRRGERARERGTAIRANPGSYAIEIDPRHRTDTFEIIACLIRLCYPCQMSRDGWWIGDHVAGRLGRECLKEFEYPFVLSWIVM